MSDCLGKIRPNAGVRDATKDVMNVALDLNFAIPGDPGWPLNQVSRCSLLGGERKRGIETNEGDLLDV